MKKQTKKYWVRTSNLKGWCRVLRAAEQPSAWLHYELRDGVTGLARPGNWTSNENEVHGITRSMTQVGEAAARTTEGGEGI
jgi:hypothetical protein